jgi:hypothetical protein
VAILIVRHGLSSANDRNSEAFGHADAPLLPLGVEQSVDAGRQMASVYGIDAKRWTAAASEMRRSQDTASAAGFTVVRSYAVLNEVDVPKTPDLKAALNRREIIPEARAAAQAVLDNPPKERIWFSHGYLIAALCELTEVDTSGLRFIPRFGEIRELPINPLPLRDK